MNRENDRAYISLNDLSKMDEAIWLEIRATRRSNIFEKKGRGKIAR